MTDEAGNGGGGGGGSHLMVYIRIGLRALALLFAIVVMGVISDKLQSNSGYDGCIFGLKYEINGNRLISANSGDKNACNYGIGIAVLTLLFVIAFIVLDVFLFLLGKGNAVIKKFVTIGDLVVSCLLAFLWMVGFIYLLDKWDDAGPKSFAIDGEKIDDFAPEAGAAIAFSLFSAIVWVVLAIMAGIRVRQAVA